MSTHESCWNKGRAPEKTRGRQPKITQARRARYRQHPIYNTPGEEAVR
jgi:hypothetical protein